jgi:glycosyltransferase involved in cell wall biosynthesis
VGSSLSLDALPPEVTVVRLTTNGGPGRARQVGTELVDTDLVSYLDSDDRWSPDFLAACIEHLERDPSCQAVYTPIAKRLPDGALRPFTDKPEWLDLREATVRFHAYPALAMVFRRAALLEAGGWDTTRHAVEDWDLMVRFLDRHGPVPLVRGPLPEYRTQHTPGRLNALGWAKLRCWRNTAHRNRELLQKHFGPRAHHRRLAQAVRDRADRLGGATGHAMHMLRRMLGTPLDVDVPPVRGS